MTVEEIFAKSSPLQRVCIVLGCLCYICIGIFVLFHLGFSSEVSNPQQTPIEFLSGAELIILNCSLGLLGGFLLDYKRPIISATSGLFAAISLTVFSFLYSFWRESIETIEIVIILGIGILPGLALYKLLVNFSKK